MSALTIPTQGSALKENQIICIAGLHYYTVVSEASWRNGLVFAPVPGFTSASQTIFGQANDTYQVVPAETFSALLQQRSKFPSAPTVLQGRVNSSMIQPTDPNPLATPGATPPTQSPENPAAQAIPSGGTTSVLNALVAAKPLKS